MQLPPQQPVQKPVVMPTVSLTICTHRLKQTPFVHQTCCIQQVPGFPCFVSHNKTCHWSIRVKPFCNMKKTTIHIGLPKLFRLSDYEWKNECSWFSQVLMNSLADASQAFSIYLTDSLCSVHICPLFKIDLSGWVSSHRDLQLSHCFIIAGYEKWKVFELLCENQLGAVNTNLVSINFMSNQNEDIFKPYPLDCKELEQWP